ncbi:probable ATP-dependent DNA helicase HFM1 [Palaemon carinicauda]|uniref:probable ATP-dependent DNA helicase HFM1 n=1 Tax=Palaemon carinicauda TaxID=392227 RepID=UPI0035B5B143
MTANSFNTNPFDVAPPPEDDVSFSQLPSQIPSQIYTTSNSAARWTTGIWDFESQVYPNSKVDAIPVSRPYEVLDFFKGGSRPFHQSYDSQPTQHDYDSRPTQQHYDSRPAEQNYDSQPAQQNYDSPIIQQNYHYRPDQQNYSGQYWLNNQTFHDFSSGGEGSHSPLRSVSEIPPEYQSLFSQFPYFNVVQSTVFDDVFCSDCSVVVSAPTGSGKTVIMELAILRLLTVAKENSRCDDGNRIHPRVVYMAPMKALVSERYSDWKQRMSPLGVTCAEVTGDTDHDDIAVIKGSQIVLTTPEKWDSLTRRWRDHTALMQAISLLLIDEVHVLNSEDRGPTLEAVVSRMKTIRSTRPSDRNSNIRFVAVSATIPNVSDVAAWLSDNKGPALFHTLEERLRPVKLQRIVLCYDCHESWSDFRFEISLNYKLPSVIATYSNNKPTLIFVSTRKSAQTTATTLCQQGRFVRDAKHKQLLLTVANSLRDSRLRECVMCGVGYHHAGIDTLDRRQIEVIFTAGELLVLVATSTLAVGVNLPAHLVIIKSTAQYVGGSYQEYSSAQLLQMTGRAGRPQFDSEATAVIMTKKQYKVKYENLVNGKDVLESHLHLNLVEHLNAEIVLGTVTDLAVAVEWLRSTFFYVRVQHNPRHYGLPLNMKPSQLESKLQELCTREINGLARAGLIELDEMDVKPTTPGKLMARFCVSFNTMKTFLQLRGDESLKELVEILSSCREFNEVKVRMSEKRVLNELNKSAGSSIRFPIAGKIKTREQKINCLIQAVLGSQTIVDPGLNQESTKIMRTGQRITKCLAEYGATRRDYELQLNTALLAKSFICKLWENSRHVTRQLGRIGPTFSAALVQAKIVSFTALEETSPRNIELILNRQPPFGNRIWEQAAKLPRYELTLEQMNEVRGEDSDIKVTIRLANHAELKAGATTPKNHSSRLIIGDMDNNVVFQQRITDNALMVAGSVTRELTVSRVSSGDELAVNFVSESWAGLDVQSSYTPRYLNKPPAPASMSSASSSSSVRGSTSGTPISDDAKRLSHTGTTKRTNHEEVRRACLHTCNNKRVCAHNCCKVGVTVQTTGGSVNNLGNTSNSKGSLPAYVQEIRKKSRQMQDPIPKKLKMTDSSGNTLSKFKFSPRGPMLMAKPTPKMVAKEFHNEFDLTFSHKEREDKQMYPQEEGESHLPSNLGDYEEKANDSFPDMEAFIDLEDQVNYEDSFNDSLEISDIPDIQDIDGQPSCISSNHTQTTSNNQTKGIGFPPLSSGSINTFTKASTLSTYSKPYLQQQQQQQKRHQGNNQSSSKAGNYQSKETRPAGQLSLDRWLKSGQNNQVKSRISPTKSLANSVTSSQNLSTSSSVTLKQGLIYSGVNKFMARNQTGSFCAQTCENGTKNPTSFKVPFQQGARNSNPMNLQVPRVANLDNLGFQVPSPRFVGPVSSQSGMSGLQWTQDPFKSQNNSNVLFKNPSWKNTAGSANDSNEQHTEGISAPMASNPEVSFSQIGIPKGAVVSGAKSTLTTFVLPHNTHSICNPSDISINKSQNVIDNLRKTQELIDMLKTQTENLEELKKSVQQGLEGYSEEQLNSHNSNTPLAPAQNSKGNLFEVMKLMARSNNNKFESIQSSDREGRSTSLCSLQGSSNMNNEPVTSVGKMQQSFESISQNHDRTSQVHLREQILSHIPAKPNPHQDKPIMGVKPMMTKDHSMTRSQARGKSDAFPQLTQEFISSQQSRSQCKPNSSKPKYPVPFDASFNFNCPSTRVSESQKAEWRDIEMFQWCLQQKKRSLSNLYSESGINLPVTEEVKPGVNSDIDNQRISMESLSQDLFAESTQEAFITESSPQPQESDPNAQHNNQETFSHKKNPSSSLHGIGQINDLSSQSVDIDPSSQLLGSSPSLQHVNKEFSGELKHNFLPTKPTSSENLTVPQFSRPTAQQQDFKPPAFRYANPMSLSQRFRTPSAVPNLQNIELSNLHSLHSGPSSQMGTQNPESVMSAPPRFQLTYGPTQTGVGLTSVGGFQQNININLSSILPNVTPAQSTSTLANTDTTPAIGPLRGILKKSSDNVWENRSDIFDGLF